MKPLRFGNDDYFIKIGWWEGTIEIEIGETIDGGYESQSFMLTDEEACKLRDWLTDNL